MLKKLLLSLLFVGTLLHATPATQENLTKLYIATFDRAPDADGLQYWLDSGWEIEAIAISFFDQEETQVKYPEGFSLEDFIEAIYNNLFDRGADSDGFEYWLEALQKDEALRPLFILAVMNGALGDDAKLLNNRVAVGLAFVRAGRNGIVEASTILSTVTYDKSTINPALCKHTLAGCYTPPVVEEEEEEITTSTSGGSSGGSSGGGAVAPPADTTPPVITLTGDATVNLTVGDSYTDAGATASDDTDGDITSSIVKAGDTVDTATAGTYVVTYNVDDAAGNSATEVTRSVVVTEPDCPDGSSFITHNGTNYCTVTSPHTSKVWLDRNLGASQVCTAFDDTDCYGDYYQWGRDADGHQVSTSGDGGTIVDDVNNLNNAGDEFIKNGSEPYDWASVDNDGSIRKGNWSATDGSSICPIGYRVPTKAELTAETTGASPAVANRDDAFNSFLKLPSAGYRDNSSGSLGDQGSDGYLWSASSMDGSKSRLLYFFSSTADWGYVNRANGQSVRCLRD